MSNIHVKKIRGGANTKWELSRKYVATKLLVDEGEVRDLIGSLQAALYNNAWEQYNNRRTKPAA